MIAIIEIATNDRANRSHEPFIQYQELTSSNPNALPGCSPFRSPTIKPALRIIASSVLIAWCTSLVLAGSPSKPKVILWRDSRALFSWRDSHGIWQYSLLVDQNMLPSVAEIKSQKNRVGNVKALPGCFARIPRRLALAWRNLPPTDITYPDQQTIEKVKALAKANGIELEILPSLYE